MLKQGDKKSCIKISQKQDQLALKNIVEPFLGWHNSLFGKCVEEIKKFPNHTKLMEEYFSSDCGFEVNKETLYNILSAELQSSSKIESLRTFQILPAVPTSIAKGTNLEKETYSSKLKESFHRESVNANKQKSFDFKEDEYLNSCNFIDTVDLCKNLIHFRIVEEFLNNSPEYEEYIKIKNEKV